MNERVVALLREAAEELKAQTGSSLVIPKTDPEDGPYPLRMKPGRYPFTEVAHAVSFLADMLEG